MADTTDWKESLGCSSDDLSPIRKHTHGAAHSEATRSSTALNLSPAAVFAPRNQAEAHEIITMPPELVAPAPAVELVARHKPAP